MNPSQVRVTRDVPVDDKNNYLGRDVKEGETFYLFNQHTYGCISRDGSGVALSKKPGEYPFFEFPADAIEEAPDPDQDVWDYLDGVPSTACGHCGYDPCQCAPWRKIGV